jgi:hypothetical protein
VDKQLEALTEAYKILTRAKVDCASYAAMQPYRLVSHAQDYIQKQADELLKPIFADETVSA